MHRLLLLALVLLAPTAGAQGARLPLGVALGTRLRLATRASERDVIGTLVATFGDTLVVQTRDESGGGVAELRFEQVVLPGDQIQRAFVSTGRESRVASGARGAAYGVLFAVALSGIGRMVSNLNDDGESSGPNPDASWTDRASFANALVHVALVTVPLGAVAGAFRPAPRWTEIPVTATR